MITVAIPAFNGSKFIEQAVSSVINQTYDVEEIIIIDDSSSDNTNEKASEIIKKNPGRKIRLISNEKNIGYQANWNKCFDSCTTRYLIILHQDDMLKRDSCKKLISFLELNPGLALAGGDEEISDASGKPLIQKSNVEPDAIFNKGQIYEFITATSTYIPCSSVMFDMEKIRQVGGFEADVSAADELFWPKVLTSFPIAKLGTVLISRGSHPDQAEYRSFINDEKRALSLYQRFRDLALLEERVDRRGKIYSFLRKKFFKGYIGIISVSLARRGYILLSLKYICKAFRINPVGFIFLPSLFKCILKIKYFIFIELMKRLIKPFAGLSDSLTRYLIRIYFTDKLEDSLADCDTVLELGAGKFSYLRSLKKKFHITAFDIDQRSLDLARESNVYDDYIIGDVKEIGNHFNENSFDSVVAFDLIEHLGKDEGLQMIMNMERIAKKRIIIYTPNGFLPQDTIDGNIFQKHISGWSHSEMKGYQFSVSGVNGLRVLRGSLALPRIRPNFLGYFISNLSWIILKITSLDRYCFSILCIKNKN